MAAHLPDTSVPLVSQNSARPSALTQARAPELAPPHDPWTLAGSDVGSVRSRLLALARRETSAIAAPIRHHVGAPGKMLRARLALGAAVAVGGSRPAAIELACAAELAHEASLLHDDLQDRDRERRSQPAVWVRFGDAAAINAGDFLLAHAFASAAQAHAELPAVLAAAVSEVVRGQADELAARGDVDRTAAEMQRIAAAKTAPLIAFPIEGALILASAASGSRAHARDVAHSLAIAFQLQDDVLDLFYGKGREAGSDLREGRATAPVRHFLSSARRDDRERLLALLRSAPARDTTLEAPYWAARIRASHAVEATLAEIASFEAEAFERAALLPGGLHQLLLGAARVLLAPSHRLQAERSGRNAGEPTLSWRRTGLASSLASPPAST